ncbi:hypothetical protein ABVK25_004417 [Lepraria finkii]|uniref:beta-glucosidase n=1 Tax=Lepraria finkii TaxID=1340010 RepID=A0ABR4BB49_9LECA
MADINVEEVLGQLTLEEKASLTAGRDFWHTNSIPRLGVPSIRASDGPNGVRGIQFFNGTPAACLPCGTALGATFDTDLINSTGRLLGQEAKAKGASILLGPTINIQRAPLGGRGFESFSEDPFLSGTLAGEYCKGVQEEDIMTTPKHLVCNDQEHERLAVNSIVTDRALREIYLMPFMLAIKAAKPAAVMTAYNKVNGTHAAENSTIIDILRKEWGWEGLLMSDWYGTYSTSKAIKAGLDLEMPGPTKWRGAALPHAVTSNKIRPHVLDARVRAVLNAVKLACQSGIPEDAEERELNRPEDQKFIRRVAAESIVLLKNENNVLPFDKNKTVAVIGPNAKVATFSGGGSASLLPYYAVTPFDGMTNQCDVRFSQGAYSHKELPLLGLALRTSEGKVGFDFRAYDKPVGDPDRTFLDRLHLTNSYMFVMDYKVPNYNSPLYYVDVEGTFTPEEDGLYDFGLTVQGTGKLFIDGELIVENVHNQKPGTAFFGAGTIEEIGSIKLVKGKPYKLTVEFGTAPTAKSSDRATVSFGSGGLRVGGCRRLDPKQAIKDAVKLASQVHQVVIFAGLNSDWESEGSDRPHMDLPPYSDELKSQGLEANPKAAIVLQSGTPVTMHWADKASALVQAWYGGNETGNAIADVLFGNVNPSGKLPLSFPVRIEDNPAFLNYRSERGRVLYGEDIYVGYRFYEKLKRPTLFPFGHGLSYTSFELSDLEVSATALKISVKLAVANTGSRAGAEVIQVYVNARSPSINRAVKELKGFKKVYLEAGEKSEVEIEVDKKYATSFWDEGRDAWIVEKGEYQVLAGTSSQGSFLEGSFEVEETWWWNGL